MLFESLPVISRACNVSKKILQMKINLDRFSLYHMTTNI